MRKGVLLSLVLAGILFLGGCSGGDSGGSSDTSSKAKITVNNVDDITQSAFQATNSVVTSGGAISNELGRSGEEKASFHGRNVVAGMGAALLSFLGESNVMADIGEAARAEARARFQIDDISGTRRGLYGGTATYNVSTQGSSFKMIIVFDDYTSYPEEYLDGTLVLTGRFDSQNDTAEGSMNISFDAFRVRYANDFDYTVSGTMTMEGEGQEAVFTADATIKDQLTGITSKVEDYVLDMTIESSNMIYTVAGSFLHSKYGKVTISTEEAFRQQVFAEHPSDGIMMIEGTEGTKSRLTILDSSSYMIEADLNGDGTFEWNSGTLHWTY